MKNRLNKIQYAVKVDGQPKTISRNEFTEILKGTVVTRRHRMTDNTRVFGTANGNILYMQVQTLRQRRYWAK